MMFSLHVMRPLLGAIVFRSNELLVPSGIGRVGSMIRQLIAFTEPRAEECGQLCCAIRVHVAKIIIAVRREIDARGLVKQVEEGDA